MGFQNALTAEIVVRTLLADTGAGTQHSAWHLILTEEDCHLLQIAEATPVNLGGAFIGTFPTFVVEGTVEGLGESRLCVAVAVPSDELPKNLDGIAGIRLLNSFRYGNFGDPDRFGLQRLTRTR